MTAMTRADLVLRSRRVSTPTGERPASVHVSDGRVTAVAPPGDVPAGVPLVDLGEVALLPGLVDTHVHVNEPGRTEWEGFATATRAAAAGGVTTLLDMPLNSVPPTTTVAGLARKREAAAGRCSVDVGFWGGAVPGNLGELGPLHDAGVFGFKSFLVDSGVAEFGCLDFADLPPVAAAVAALGSVLIVHAEAPGPLRQAPPAQGPGYAGYLASRPPEAETEAIAELVRVAAATGARSHVLHLSAAPALPLLAAARSGGVPVSAETCPHYLTLTAEEVPDGATEFKCAPPIRDAANRDALWRGLAAGEIDQVVSDHSPCPPGLKRPDGVPPGAADFGRAWGGISSLQLGLPAVWTEASRRGHPLSDVVGWMATNPARFAGLDGKGLIAPGYDADLVAFDPDEVVTVTPASLHHRHHITPYAGRRLRGAVLATWLRGRQVARDGRMAGRPQGRLLRRGGGT
jgi:allantoinase